MFFSSTTNELAGPGEELDLMFYYNTNPAISTSELTDMSIDRAKLAEEDAIALFENSLIRLNVSCEQGRCAPCVNDISCQAGLTCSLFRQVTSVFSFINII